MNFEARDFNGALLDTLPLEQDVDHPRVLVMEYTVRCSVRSTIMPGMGSISRAVEDVVRVFAGQPNIDPHSIRFQVIDR